MGIEVPNLCQYADVKISDIDAIVVVQNLALIVGIVVVLLVSHIVVISAVEAFWVSMVSQSRCYWTTSRHAF